MKKIDAKAMYSYGLANRVAQDLNKDTSFALFGEINITGGLISRPEFIKVLDYFYCQNIKGKNENQLYFEIRQEIKNKFNALINADISYGTKKYSYAEILVVLYVFSRMNEIEEIDKYISYMISKLEGINKTRLQPGRKIGKLLIDDLDKLFEEVK